MRGGLLEGAGYSGWPGRRSRWCRWPVTVVLVLTVVYVAAALADVGFTPWVSNTGPNLAIAVFTAADRSPRKWSLTAAAVAGAHNASFYSARDARGGNSSASPLIENRV